MEFWWHHLNQSSKSTKRCKSVICGVFFCQKSALSGLLGLLVKIVHKIGAGGFVCWSNQIFVWWSKHIKRITPVVWFWRGTVLELSELINQNSPI